MEQNILEEIANLQKRYNDKLQEYEQASLEHKNHIRKYGEICNDAKFEKCADERARCEITGEKTVRFGISPNMYTYANHNQPILCTKSFFNNVEPAHGKEKSCYIQDKCRHPGEFNGNEIQMSKDRINEKIDDLKTINVLLLEKIKELLNYRDQWGKSFSDQEKFLMDKLEEVKYQRERLETVAIPVAESIVGQYEDTSMQIDQTLTQYMLWGGALSLVGIAFYLLFRNSKKAGGVGQMPRAINLSFRN